MCVALKCLSIDCLFKNSALLIVGIVIGWVVRDLALPAQEKSKMDASLLLGRNIGVEERGRLDENISDTQQRGDFSEPSENKPPLLTGQVDTPFGLSEVRHNVFSELLQQQKYYDAVILYQEAYSQNTGKVGKMKKELLSYLTSLLKKAQYEQFIEMTDTYLAEFYNDLDVLMSLVIFNQKMEYYTEAVDLYQLMYSYVYEEEEVDQVRSHYQEFIAKVDQHLSAQERWSELINLYLHIGTAGISVDEDRFRLAEVYLLAKESNQGREILLDLVSSPSVGSKSQALLKKIASSYEQNEVVDSGRSAKSESVKLQRRGEHYLVPIRLAEQDLALVLDTGASMTTITQSSFDEIAHTIEYQELGTRMFHTASGISKGSIYQVEALTLGGYKLKNIDIAVLDFDMAGQANGLLGMNTLRHFRFEINQDKAELNLEPR